MGNATARVKAEITLEVGLTEGTDSTSLNVHDDLQTAIGFTGAVVEAVQSYEILPADEETPAA